LRGSDALTVTAVSTVAPPVGRPMADTGIVKPWSDAQSALSLVVASSARAVMEAAAISAQMPAPKACFSIAFLMEAQKDLE
jgi:hypothetical protein